MSKRGDSVEFAAGFAVTATGFAISIFAATRLEVGTLAAAGPGLFPAAVGLVQAIFGLCILAPALVAQRKSYNPDFRAAIAVCAGTAFFALTIANFGLIPATLGLCLISCFASTRPNLVQAGVTAAGIGVLAYVVFVVALGSRIPLINWPF